MVTMYTVLLWMLLVNLGAAQFTTEDLGCHGGRCYTLLPTCTQFKYAGRMCGSLPQGGGQVASVPDADTGIYLVSKLSTYGVEPIIGGIDVRGPWRWTTGQRYYDIAQPSTPGSPSCDLDTCGFLDPSGALTAAPCTDKKRFLCKASGAQLMQQTVYVSSVSYSWHVARAQCKRRNQELLTLGENQLETLKGILASSGDGAESFWVGLYSRKWIWYHNREEIIDDKLEGPSGSCGDNLALKYNGDWETGGDGCLCETGGSPAPPFTTTAGGLNVTDLGCMGSTCFKLVNPDRSSFFHGGRSCTDIGMHLATLEDESTHLYVMSQLFRMDTWPYIAITDVRIPWSWVTGAAFNGRISRAEDEEEKCDLRTCGVINLGASSSTLEAMRCDEKRRFICRTAGNALNINEVQISSSRLTWFTAREDCKSRGLDLLTVREDMLQTVKTQLQQKIGSSDGDFWIGLYARKWVSTYSGEEVVYSRFDPIDCHNHFVLVPHRRVWTPQQGCCSSALCQTGSNVRPVISTQGLNVTSLGCVGSRCYSLVLTEASIPSAGRHCQALGGVHLASVPDARTNLHLLIAVSHWGVFPYIGAVVITTPWTWVTGGFFIGSVESTPQDPYYKCDVNTCASLTYIQGGPIVRARQCWTRKPFICTKTGFSITASNVYVSLIEYSWYAARIECRRRGMELLSATGNSGVNYEDLKQVVQSVLQRPPGTDDEFWMGVHSKKYVWIHSGEEVIDYFNVRLGDTCYEAVALDFDGTWYPRAYCCTSFICERGPVPNPTYGVSDTGQNVTSVGCVGSRCYWLVLKKSYTRDAGAECAALMGAHLATVPDERTNLFLLGRITQWGVAPYLGALAIKMPWTWVDQSKYSGELGNDSMPVNTCGMLQLRSGSITVVAADCMQREQFVCHKKGAAPSAVIVGENPYTWHVARQECLQRGLDLLTYSDTTEGLVHSTLRSMYGGTINLWVGLYKRKWIWVHNTQEITYTRFLDLDPEKDFLIMYGEGNWKSTYGCCAPVLCETGGEVSVNTQTPKPDDMSTSVVFAPLGTPVPSGGKGGTSGSSPTENASFDPILHAVVPAVAAAVLGAVIVVILCLYMRRVACFAKPKAKKKKKRSPNAHDNLAVGGPVTYVANASESSNHYVEITDPPDYQGLDPLSTRTDNQYEELSPPKNSQ